RDGLEGIRVEADLREEHTPGWKFNEHEMRGVPIRLEIGPRDIEKDQVMLVSRDTGAKRPEKIGSVRSAVERELERIQEDLLVKARALVEDKTVRPKNLEDFEAAAADGGFMVAGWCGNVGCEAHVKERTTATIRAIPFEPEAASCQILLAGLVMSGRRLK
ncbi:MAG: His/Gly/Thr/Pro-type tRNA ligase C-terminal domain-containing protein, partial [Terriglobia bacterium]